MRSTRMNHPAVLLAVLAMTPLAPRPSLAQVFGGEKFTSQGPNCYGLRLKAATGVPGVKHTYTFVGSCSDGNRSFPAEAHVEWQLQGLYTLSEDFAILGTYVNPEGKSYSGHVQSVFRCNDDPLISNAVCNPVSHHNYTGAKFLSRPYLEERRPITKGKTTLAEAKALSQAAMAVAEAIAKMARLKGTAPGH